MPNTMTELEEEFRELVEKGNEQIQEKIAIAARALREAVELSEQYGIPFYSRVSFLSQPYIPRSWNSKYSQLDDEVLEDLIEVSSYDISDRSGWKHSAVC